MKPDQQIEIGFQVQAIRVTDFAIHDVAGSTPDTVGFNIALQHGWVADTENWVVEVSTSIGAGESQPSLAELIVEYQYRLEGYNNWLRQQEADLVPRPGTLPAGLAVTLNSISLSTTRGILFERLANTYLQQTILPIIDPLSFQIDEQ